MKDDDFYIPKRERVGYIALIVCLLLIAGVVFIVYHIPRKEYPITLADKALLDSFTVVVESTGHAHSRSVELFYFDPNTVDSVDMLRLGFTDWQIRNNMKYRRLGGRWRSASHFSHLYGLSTDHYERLKPYIHIHRESASRNQFFSKEKTSASRIKVERPRYAKNEKFSSLVILNLNTVDTTTLKKIPGIGSYYARKIVDYRAALGGFVSVKQILEVEGLPADIMQWFELDGHLQVRKLDLNKMTFRELVRHPYLNYDQVKAIFEVRRKTGFVNGWQSLLLYDCFSQSDVDRLSPYVEL